MGVTSLAAARNSMDSLSVPKHIPKIPSNLYAISWSIDRSLSKLTGDSRGKINLLYAYLRQN